MSEITRIKKKIQTLFYKHFFFNTDFFLKGIKYLRVYYSFFRFIKDLGASYGNKALLSKKMPCEPISIILYQLLLYIIMSSIIMYIIIIDIYEFELYYHSIIDLFV